MARAEHHHRELAALYAETFEPGLLRFKVEPDGDPHRCLIRVWNVPVIGRDWALLMGDVLTNLRAALDYLAWQLVDQHGPDKPTWQTKFPIDDYPFTRSGRAKATNFIPAVTDSDVLDRLERHQPWRGFDHQLTDYLRDPTERALWQLNALCNLDKHRLPVLMVPRFDPMRIAWALPIGVTSLPLTASIMPIKDGDVVARMGFDGMDVPEDFDPRPAAQLSIWEPQVRWAARSNVREMLGTYISTVKVILTDFGFVLQD